MSPDEFAQRLQAQLPAEVPLHGVEEVSLQMPSATKSLDRAEYLLAVSVEVADSMDGSEDKSEAGTKRLAGLGRPGTGR